MEKVTSGRKDVNNSRILVIVVGGNISQLTGDGDIKLEPASEYQFKEFLFKGNNNDSVFLREGKVSKLIFVDVERLIDVDNLEKQDSSQVNPEIWEKLAKMIKGNYEDYEGFVVLHGLDTLAYTASAISFMIRNLTKPIVFTGSQRPLNFPRSDAPQNIYTALTIAASKSLGLEPPINEVTIYLHDTLYRANRASMSSASSYRSFDSLNYPSLATIGEHVDIKDNLVFKPPANNITSFATRAHKKIQIIDVFPGMSSSLIEGIVGLDLDKIYIENLKQVAQKKVKDKDEESNFNETEDYKILTEIEVELSKQTIGERIASLFDDKKKNTAIELINSLEKESTINDNRIKGVILRTYGMGTLPTDVLMALKKLVDNEIVVMNVTQAHSSRVSFNSDLVSLRLFEYGVISGLDMTSEAAFAKMVVVISNDTKGITHCEDELQNNIAGEQSHSVSNFHFNGGETLQYAMNDEEKRKLYNHKSKLTFKNSVVDFAFNSDRIGNINNIQLRILGLKKIKSGGGKVRIKIYRCDDNVQKIIEGKEIHKFEEILDDPDEKIEVKTVNVSFDITNLKGILFSRDAVFHIVSDQQIIWSKISIVIYS